VQFGFRKNCSTIQALKDPVDDKDLLCWYLHLVVVEELEYPNNPESYAVGSLATGRATLGGQVEG